MSKILILSKTRMQEGRVCVGGVDLDNKCSVRLLNKDGYHDTIEECPYEILRIWDVEYNKIFRRPAPHLEDICVSRRERTSRIVKPKELLKLSFYNIKIYNKTPLSKVFEEKLSSTPSGSLYISEEKGVPSFSTCFWVCDKPLRKNRFSTEQKIKYDYVDNLGKWYHITCVSIDSIPDIIPTGTLIRLSLAHWWHPEGTETENRCYLQLSGIFNIDG